MTSIPLGSWLYRSPPSLQEEGNGWDWEFAAQRPNDLTCANSMPG